MIFDAWILFLFLFFSFLTVSSLCIILISYSLDLVTNYNDLCV